MKDAPRAREFFAYVFLTAAFANGAVLANNFVPLLFFWEGLLVTLYGLITIGGQPTSSRTAVKALLISGFCDFSMIMGIGLVWSLSGTLTMSKVSLEPTGLAAAAFILMMVGAIGKAGAMPFHTWIPDAALDAPVTFMAFLPAAFEKLLGIYLLARISLDFFKVKPGSGLSILMMTIGAATIVLAVLMALVQKDFKKLLSFHAISQVGYMVLGVGTGIPIGIAGGVFHMINHAMYKCGLFLSAGSVEHRTGTTELREARRAPEGDAPDGLRFHGLRPGHFRRLAPERVCLQGDGLPRRGRNRLHRLRHRRLGRGDLHLRLVPQGRPLRLLRPADDRGPGGQGKPGADRPARSWSWPGCASSSASTTSCR